MIWRALLLNPMGECRVARCGLREVLATEGPDDVLDIYRIEYRQVGKIPPEDHGLYSSNNVLAFFAGIQLDGRVVSGPNNAGYRGDYVKKIQMSNRI